MQYLQLLPLIMVDRLFCWFRHIFLIVGSDARVLGNVCIMYSVQLEEKSSDEKWWQL